MTTLRNTINALEYIFNSSAFYIWSLLLNGLVCNSEDSVVGRFSSKSCLCFYSIVLNHVTKALVSCTKVRVASFSGPRFATHRPASWNLFSYVVHCLKCVSIAPLKFLLYLACRHSI